MRSSSNVLNAVNQPVKLGKVSVDIAMLAGRKREKWASFSV